uniref:TEF transcription factor, PAR bZIP family member n=1 Tax=Eptatretus burgeri TaxID=7764 RepID=A0A8C4PXW1_EPTBU
ATTQYKKAGVSVCPSPLYSLSFGVSPAKRSLEPFEVPAKKWANDGSGDGGGGRLPAAAFLGPMMWDKMLPYSDTFEFEYMDLDEFLSENGISPSAPLPSQPNACNHVLSMNDCEHDIMYLLSFCTGASMELLNPIDPHSIEVPVGYEPDPLDLVLSSVPGQEIFDPRQRRFTEDELRPQPIMKKAKKMLIPEDLKDDRYWLRRKKNNQAAKRSRDARRLKENQISVRAAFLEKENSALRQELAEMKHQLLRWKL